MRRWWWLALIVTVAAAAFLRWGLPAPQEPEGPGDPYVPRDLPAEVRARLVVWDHPWPHANPVAEPDRFQGERPHTWEQRLEAAVAAFRQRYPNVEVVVDVRPFATQAAAGAASEPPAPRQEETAGPDVASVWWSGPLPAVEDLVPLNRYLTEAAMAEYHPVAWSLVEAGGSYWGWPRWVAMHYWVAGGAVPGAGDAENGWSIDEALQAAAADGVLAPPAAGWMLLELAAGRLAPPTPPDDGDHEGAAGVSFAADTGPSDAEAVARLAAALGQLRALLAGVDADESVGRRLAEARFGLAAGFGPAVGHWAVSPPLSGRSRPDEQKPALIHPPAVVGEPVGLPVLSPGAYVVFRKAGPDEGTRAQLAVELARHLSAWQAEAAVARLLALPAHLAALERWRSAPPLAPPTAERLLADLDRSAAEGPRVYGRPEPTTPPRDPAAAAAWWSRWRSGELTDEMLARLLLGASAAPTLAATRDGGP
ncbi:MAG TPA: hypothetical protein VF282_04080 [Bacillota bacterium]